MMHGMPPPCPSRTSYAQTNYNTRGDLSSSLGFIGDIFIFLKKRKKKKKGQFSRKDVYKQHGLIETQNFGRLLSFSISTIGCSASDHTRQSKGNR